MGAVTQLPRTRRGRAQSLLPRPELEAGPHLGLARPCRTVGKVVQRGRHQVGLVDRGGLERGRGIAGRALEVGDRP